MPKEDRTIPELGGRFRKIKEAREILKQRAAEIVELYMKNAEAAHEAEQFEVASKSLQWLIEHMPADDETGEKVVDTSVDKQAKQNDKNSGPTFNIGFAVGGLPPRKELPKQKKALPKVEVVEVKDE